MRNLFHDTCIVLGNGPSLRGFDLHRLKDFTTLGMNAAYRHWDRIGWYPTYYSCLDDQLIKTHHAEIERLYASGLIKKFFLHGSFFDYHPHRVNNTDFTSFYQTSGHWYHTKGKALGLERLYDKPAFKMSDTSKITTGAHSIRYAANLGHDRIVLMGIDLRYVEILPEAEATSNIGLVIKNTPAHNPNYFFDSYQQAGDLYNIPNPTVHGGNLHVQSLELIAKDFAINDVPCTVYNTNRASILSDKDFFPYISIEEVTGESTLGSVMVPSNAGEIDTILANFRLWNTVEFSPSDRKVMCNRPALVFVFNNLTAQIYQDSIRQAYAENGMERFFRKLCFEYLDLQGDQDVYLRDYTKPVGDGGYKAGPNNQFFSSIRRIAPYGGYTFLMETDCLPMRRGWLSKLQALVDGSEPFWIMGSVYRGLQKLSKDFVRHLNGNAVYATGNADFQTFVTDFWETHTWRLIREKDKRLAYDCILEIMFSQENIRDQEVMDVWKQTAHKFKLFDFLQNISGSKDIADTTDATVSDLRHNHPDTYILHNRTAHKIVLKQLDEGSFDAGPRISNPLSHPRILVFDMTPTGNCSATGEIKSNLLQDWPADAFLQIAKHDTAGMAAVRRDGDRYVVKRHEPNDMRAAVDAFAPDIVLYRPTPDAVEFHAFAKSEVDRLGKPLITWLMDDWPARMAAEQSVHWARMETDLQQMLRQSVTCLSICEAMSDAFVRRYGVAFRPLANGIDPAEWIQLPRPERKTFVIRYAGGIAEDMNRASLLQVAEAVERLAKSGLDIKFEISTQRWWMEQCKALFANFTATTMELSDKTTPEYRRWIREADLLLIAYNFDAQSLLYMQYSMANKLPECLASGVPVLAYGPKQAATINYIAEGDFARVVSSPGVDGLQTAIRELHEAPATRAAIGSAGRRQAFAHHNLHRLRRIFAGIVARAAVQAPFDHVSQQSHEELVSGFSYDMSALRAQTLALSSQVLLGRKTLSEGSMGPEATKLIARAQATLPVDDSAITHFQRLRRFNALPAHNNTENFHNTENSHETGSSGALGRKSSNMDKMT